MYKAIFFDLDGTLTDSGPGITRCVNYALQKMGRPEEDPENLRCFVGPPLKDMFMQYAGFTEEEALQAVTYYRERFAPIGIYENSPYPGIEALLEELQGKGYRLAIASSKPEHFVHIVLEYFHLEGYFSCIVGCEMDGSRGTKAEAIEEACRRMGLQKKKDQILMVGDTHYDVEGARAVGIETIAVTWGYDTLKNLEESHPLALAGKPSDIAHFFA